MRLTVVGCAGSYPSVDSAASCYLVEHDGARLVLDLGSGAIGPLQQYVDLGDPDALSAVVLSHCHVDHCADVASLYVLRHHGPVRPSSRLPLIGPSDTADRLAAIYGMPDALPIADEFDVRSLGAGPIVVGPFTIESVQAAHPVEAYCLRITAGDASITYSGDTGPTRALVDLAAGTHVALFEASFVGADNPADLHLSAAQAAQAAREADATLLVLTHHVAWNDAERVLAEAAAEFDGPIEQAWPGMAVEL